MSTAGTLATFLVVWWLVFFMALPLGVQADENPIPGADRGAPARPHLLMKALVTTILAALATWGIDWLLTSGLVDFRGPPPS